MEDRSDLKTVTVNGKQVEMFVSKFEDKTFVVITQMGKIGTMVNVKCDITSNSAEPVFHTKTLLGNDTTVHHMFAKAVGVTIYKKIKSTKPVLCSLALTDISPIFLKQICDELAMMI